MFLEHFEAEGSNRKQSIE
jgi:hypothetical protein